MIATAFFMMIHVCKVGACQRYLCRNLIRYKMQVIESKNRKDLYNVEDQLREMIKEVRVWTFTKLWKRDLLSFESFVKAQYY